MDKDKRALFVDSLRNHAQRLEYLASQLENDRQDFLMLELEELDLNNLFQMLRRSLREDKEDANQ